jgi:hypothetical protein
MMYPWFIKYYLTNGNKYVERKIITSFSGSLIKKHEVFRSYCACAFVVFWGGERPLSFSHNNQIFFLKLWGNLFDSKERKLKLY